MTTTSEMTTASKNLFDQDFVFYKFSSLNGRTFAFRLTKLGGGSDNFRVVMAK